MHEIDFLPDDYRQQQATRHNNLWRFLVLFAFIGLVAVGAITEHRGLNAKRERLRQAQTEEKSFQAQTAVLAAVRSDVNDLRPFAELVAYLDHPWPRTQVLDALLRRLPESITLDEIRIHRQTTKVGPRVDSLRPLRRPEKTDQQPPAPPAAEDLARLRQLADQSDVLVSLSGVTREHAELHRYLSGLGRIDLFTNVELLDVGSLDPKRQAFPFSVQLTLRPGHGQPRPGGKSATPNAP